MTCETLTADFHGSGLNVEFLQSLERNVNEGILHKGYAAVTQCVAFGLRQRMRRDEAVPPPVAVSGMYAVVGSCITALKSTLLPHHIVVMCLLVCARVYLPHAVHHRQARASVAVYPICQLRPGTRVAMERRRCSHLLRAARV
jgi:hypothetical protein